MPFHAPVVCHTRQLREQILYHHRGTARHLDNHVILQDSDVQGRLRGSQAKGMSEEILTKGIERESSPVPQSSLATPKPRTSVTLDTVDRI